jgi:hypothetical protein
MSRLYYFAAEKPLEACHNPHLTMLSVNQALARGHDINLEIFPEGFDFDCPNVILHADAEDAFEHPNIFLIDPNDFYEDIGTACRYCAELEWDWCDRTAHEVLAYIAAQTARVGELEVWNVWLGDRNIPQTVQRSELRLGELTADLLRAFLQSSQPFVEGENRCMTILK